MLLILYQLMFFVCETLKVFCVGDLVILLIIDFHFSYMNQITKYRGKNIKVLVLICA